DRAIAPDPRLKARGVPTRIVQLRDLELRRCFTQRFCRVWYGKQPVTYREKDGKVTELDPLAPQSWNDLLAEDGERVRGGTVVGALSWTRFLSVIRPLLPPGASTQRETGSPARFSVVIALPGDRQCLLQATLGPEGIRVVSIE